MDGFRAEAQLCRYFERGPALSEKSDHFSLTPTQALSCRVITFHDGSNLGFAKLASVLVRFDHIASFIVNESERHSFLSASLNGMVRSTLPVESKIRISPERKHARFLS